MSETQTRQAEGTAATRRQKYPAWAVLGLAAGGAAFVAVSLLLLLLSPVFLWPVSLVLLNAASRLMVPAVQLSAGTGLSTASWGAWNIAVTVFLAIVIAGLAVPLRFGAVISQSPWVVTWALCFVFITSILGTFGASRVARRD
ncbi:hypothetical protein [Microbacterium sp. 22242]|uniref:hypothetical protein n=1 Tax=Microbacterium sp. 22242 TaxID=3453896 RepID=UPI003F859EF3